MPKPTIFEGNISGTFRNSFLELFLGIEVMKTSQTYRTPVPKCNFNNFIETTLQHGYSPVIYCIFSGHLFWEQLWRATPECHCDPSLKCLICSSVSFHISDFYCCLYLVIKIKFQCLQLSLCLIQILTNID